MRTLIHDLFTVNFYEKEAKLYNMDDLTKLINKYSDINYTIGQIPFVARRNDPRFVMTGIEKYLITNHQTVYDILTLGQGEISLCGGSLTSILYQQSINDFDIFFHCKDVTRAEEILNLIMEQLADSEEFITTQNVETIKTGNEKIQLIRRVYQNKAQIFKNFDIAASRLGWNPVDGFFGTLDGLMAIATKCFPVDTSQRSLAFDYRLNKYRSKGYNILLPGLKEYQSNKRITFTDKKFHFVQTDYKDTSNYDNDHYSDQFKWFNRYLLYSERLDQIVLNKGDKWIKLTDLCIPDLDEFLHEYYYNPTINIDTLKLYFKDKLPQFLYAKIAGDEKLCQKLWNEQRDYYLNLVTNFTVNIKTNPWKTKDFDSHLIKAKPEDWYCDNYRPVYAGISHDHYVLLRQMGKILPKDEFRALMDFILAELYCQALNRIFSSDYIF